MKWVLLEKGLKKGGKPYTLHQARLTPFKGVFCWGGRLSWVLVTKMVGGVTNEEEGRKRIDAAVGALVWVQRRNGSWWPGQIVGLDELSESSLAPRSGTPIKLLGRDDSTV